MGVDHDSSGSMAHHSSGILRWNHHAALQMDMAIHEPRSNETPGGVDLPASRIVAKSHDSVTGDGDVSVSEAAREDVDQPSSLDEEVLFPAARGRIDPPPQLVDGSSSETAHDRSLVLLVFYQSFRARSIGLLPQRCKQQKL